MKSLLIQRLAENPIIAYSIQIPEPQLLKLSAYEETAFPAVLGQLTGLSVGKIIPKYRLGNILSFDITPRNADDPIIIFSPVGNLKLYYEVWSDAIGRGIGFFRNSKIKKYDLAMTEFYQTAEESGLTKHEIVFATIEMLKFRNDVLMNPNWL